MSPDICEGLLTCCFCAQVLFMQEFVISVKRHLDHKKDVNYYVQKLASQGFCDTSSLSCAKPEVLAESSGLFPGEARVLVFWGKRDRRYVQQPCTTPG